VEKPARPSLSPSPHALFGAAGGGAQMTGAMTVDILATYVRISRAGSVRAAASLPPPPVRAGHLQISTPTTLAVPVFPPPCLAGSYFIGL
jgi:hypothetical protein